MEKKDAYLSLVEKSGYQGSKPYYKVLQIIITPDEAELLDSLPATIEELSTRFNLKEKDVRNVLDKLFKLGVVSPVPWPVSVVSDRWAFVNNVEQLQMAVMMRNRTTEFYDVWRDLQIEVSAGVGKAPLPPIRYIRIIPYYKTVRNVPGALPLDDLVEIFKAQESIALVECCCKLAMRKCDVPLDVCIQFGFRAESMVARGIARKLSVNDAIEVLEKAEHTKTPVVHSLFTNSQKLDDITALCDCCACCCGVNMADRSAGRKTWDLYAPSRFVNTVDQDKCDGCKLCLKRCNFGALKIKDGKATVDATKCVGCGSCIGFCPQDALALKVVRPLDFIPVVKQEMPLMLGWV